MPIAGEPVMRRLLPIIAILGGCAQEPPPAPVQPVRIVADGFCERMRAILPPNGKPTWDISDSPRTINDARRTGAAVDAACNPKAGGPQ